MTAPTDTKPAKRGRPKASDAPPVDFTGLTFEEAAPIKRASKSGPNPFFVPLGESYEYDKARVTVIPAAAVSRAEAMIRRAADELSIGASIQTEEVMDEEGKPTGNVKLTFQGKERRKRKSKSKAEETPETPPTAPDDAGSVSPQETPSAPVGEPVTANAGTA